MMDLKCYSMLMNYSDTQVSQMGDGYLKAQESCGHIFSCPFYHRMERLTSCAPVLILIFLYLSLPPHISGPYHYLAASEMPGELLSRKNVYHPYN